MNWFQTIAPIRAKLLFAFGLFCAIPALVGIAGIAGSPNVAIIATISGTVVAVMAN